MCYPPSHIFQLLIAELISLLCLILQPIRGADIKSCRLRQGDSSIKVCSALKLLLKPRIILINYSSRLRSSPVG